MERSRTKWKFGDGVVSYRAVDQDIVVQTIASCRADTTNPVWDPLVNYLPPELTVEDDHVLLAVVFEKLPIVRKLRFWYGLRGVSGRRLP